MTWLHSTPQRQPRTIVVLLDVSAAMEHYARAAAGFEPSTGGMSTALPYCDRFLAGDTGEAVIDVIAAMAGSND